MPVRLTVFLSDEFGARLDAWRREQDNPPTRGMALRILADRQMETAPKLPAAPSKRKAPQGTPSLERLRWLPLCDQEKPLDLTTHRLRMVNFRRARAADSEGFSSPEP
jgi:hypothetical protein